MKPRINWKIVMKIVGTAVAIGVVNDPAKILALIPPDYQVYANMIIGMVALFARAPKDDAAGK